MSLLSPELKNKAPGFSLNYLSYGGFKIQIQINREGGFIYNRWGRTHDGQEYF